MKRLLILAWVSILSGGCASIFTGTTQVIQVHTDPPGASVQIDGAQIGNTPRLIKISRGDSKLLLVYKEGYEPEVIEVGTKINGWFFGNIVIGILPGIIDVANGAWMWADPEDIRLTLHPKQPVNANKEEKKP